MTLDSSGNLICNTISLKNSSYSVGFQTPALSQSSLYVLPSSVGSIGQALTVAGYVSGINTLAWSYPKKYSFSELLFLNVSMFSGSPIEYTLSYTPYIVLDQTNATNNTTIVPPVLSGNGVYVMYLQVGGTQGGYLIGLGL